MSPTGRRRPELPQALRELERGRAYSRPALHRMGLGGETQRGISYPKAGGHALLFSDPLDDSRGYADRWGDSLHQAYHYYGMWHARGPMQMKLGNAEIVRQSPHLYLFLRAGRLHRYEGQFECVDIKCTRARNKFKEEDAYIFVLRRVIPKGSRSRSAPLRP